MDAAINAFLITVAIVGGILSPLILIMVLQNILMFLKALAHRIELWAVEAQKLPPFDDVEANLNPMTKVLSIRIKKNDKVLWQGSATRNEQEAYPTINFSQDQQQ